MNFIETTPVTERKFILELSEDEALALAAVMGSVPSIYSLMQGTSFRTKLTDTFHQPSTIACVSIEGLYNSIVNVLDFYWYKAEHNVTVKKVN